MRLKQTIENDFRADAEVRPEFNETKITDLNVQNQAMEIRKRIEVIMNKDESWAARVRACDTKADFLLLFESAKLKQENWEKGNWLTENGFYGLFTAVVRDERFKKWTEFKKFMGLEDSFAVEVRNCKTSEDFKNFFKRKNIPTIENLNSTWLTNNGFRGLLFAIQTDERFKGWIDFKKFMGEEVTERKYWKEWIAACKTPSEFNDLFAKNGLEGDDWHSSAWTQKNGFQSLYNAIVCDSRFGDWGSFKRFMGLEVEESYVAKVQKTKSVKDFKSLFEELNIPNDSWRSSAWLKKNGFGGLTQAILKDARFNSWNGFKGFMGLEVDLPKDCAEKVRSCKTAIDFMNLFSENGVPGQKWKGSKWLQKNGFAAISSAIVRDARFPSWKHFLAFMDAKSQEEENTLEIISALKLEDSVALLQDDPLKLKRYLQFSHPELQEEEIDRLVLHSFKGLRDDAIERSEEKYLAWPSQLPKPKVASDMPKQTDEPTIILEGKAPKCTHVFIAGVYTRRKRVAEDGSFALIIPLKIGQQNEIRVMGLDTDGKQCSVQQKFSIRQTSEADDVAALVDLLSELKEETFRNIQKDPGRYQYLCHTLEQSLIKKFGRSFHEGERYVKDLTERAGTSPLMRRVLNGVMKKFQKIHTANLPGVTEGSMLFFQKYCAVQTRERIAKNVPGLILANDPGTGKTRIVQAALADCDAAVIAPNSVVTAWQEEAGKVLEDTDVLTLHGVGHAIRKEQLRTRARMRKALTHDRAQHTYVNREFLRNTQDKDRFALLSNSQTVVVHDEAHSRSNEQSEQSKGARMLQSKFQLLVTATPFKNPKTFRRMMAILKPDDKRFTSDAAFNKAFPPDEPQALRALSLLKDEVTLRFRKEDVMETVDPKKSLVQQRHKLPAKEFVPPEKRGEFTMSEEQAESIYQMFINWDAWCKRNNKYIPKDEIAREDHLRTANGFAKKHALRQIINNPAYIGSAASDAKLKEMQRIVSDCMHEDRKVVIFCAYEAQVIKYAEAFKKYKPAIYTGQTSERGDVCDASGKPIAFQRGDTTESRSSWILDKNGYPIADANGDTMSALDYERITFQNTNDRKIIIATYNAGSVGTTFTAGKALIQDDLPADCVEAIQAEDRIHRIDPERLTHPTLKYYSMRSKYPQKFLNRMKEMWLVKEDGHYKEFTSHEKAKKFADASDKVVVNAYEQFFAQGTYDEVHGRNLIAQRTMFRLINDGIADESVLDMNQEAFKGLMNGNGEHAKKNQKK